MQYGTLLPFVLLYTIIQCLGAQRPYWYLMYFGCDLESSLCSISQFGILLSSLFILAECCDLLKWSTIKRLKKIVFDFFMASFFYNWEFLKSHTNENEDSSSRMCNDWLKSWVARSNDTSSCQHNGWEG